LRALTLAPQPFFSPRGTPFSVYYRALILSELGVENDLLTYGEGQDVDIPCLRIIRIPKFPLLGPVKVGPSMLKVLLDGFLLIWAFRLLCKHRYDFVHAHEESVFLCHLLRPIFGFKLVYDMHSSLPQQLENFKFTRSSALRALFDRMEKRSIQSAEAVITISPSLAEYARSRIQDGERLFLIENSIFEEVRVESGSEDGNNVEDWETRIPDSRVIVAYAGTFESYQGIDMLLRAFAQARRSVPNAFLLLIGGSQEQRQHYQKIVESLGIAPDCLLTGQLSQRLTRKLLGRANVVTSPRTDGTNTPLKIYEQLASGKPLVATRVHSHTQILDDEVCFMAEAEPTSFAEALLAALTDESRCDAVVEAASARYESRYSRAAYKAKMSRLLESLTTCAGLPES